MLNNEHLYSPVAYKDEDKLHKKVKEIASKIAGNNDYDYEYELDEEE